MRCSSGVAVLAAMLLASGAFAGPYPLQTPEPGGAAAVDRAALPAQADAAATTGAAQPADRAPEPPSLAYVVAIDGVTGELEEYLRGISVLKAKEEQPPAGRAALFRRVEDDLDRFAAALKAKGYYAYTLRHSIAYDQTPVRIVIMAEPGPAYSLAAFEIVYDKPDAPGLLKDPGVLGVAVGGPALAKPLAEAPPLLLRELGEAGYPLAKLAERSAVVDHDAEAMRVTLKIAEGPRVTFGEIRVAGLDRVDPAYVVRVSDLTPGERFDLNRVDSARRRLFATGLFESLQIKWSEQPNESGGLDVTIEAQERERRTVSVGANYSTTEGIGADVEWKHRNFFGQDEDLTLTFRVAEIEQSARAELSAPNFGRLDQTVFLSGELAREATDAYEERRIEAETGLSRPYGKRWRIGYGGELGLTRTIENQVTEDNVVVAFPLFATYDGADDAFDPSKGYKLDFRVEPTAVTLDTTSVFAQLSAGGSAYHSLLDDKRLIAAARARSAVIVGASRDQIPAGRRLYAGGGGSIRGYEYQSVGPRDAQGDPDGGTSLIEFGAELRYRVTEDFGIVPFIDGGSAFEDVHPDFDDIRFGAGLGLRYYTPIGPLRLDVATPLGRKDGENLIEVYISLGQAF